MTIIEPRKLQSQLTSVRRTGSQSFYANISDLYIYIIYISISANIEWSLLYLTGPWICHILDGTSDEGFIYSK